MVIMADAHRLNREARITLWVGCVRLGRIVSQGARGLTELSATTLVSDVTVPA